MSAVSVVSCTNRIEGDCTKAHSSKAMRFEYGVWKINAHKHKHFRNGENSRQKKTANSKLILNSELHFVIASEHESNKSMTESARVVVLLAAFICSCCAVMNALTRARIYQGRKFIRKML